MSSKLGNIVPRRVESPSSINTYRQCARKYYYQYIMKLPSAGNVHTVRGNVAHSVLEDFFDQDVSAVTKEGAQAVFQQAVQKLLIEKWTEAKPKFAEVGVTQKDEQFYFEETALMLSNFVNKFCDKIRAHPGTLQEAFKSLTPEREVLYKSEDYSVRGYIDAIERVDSAIRLMDYKTSKKFVINEDYKLQLAIYALMYDEKHGETPTDVGIYFLKDPYQMEYMVKVDQEMMDHARVQLELMHMNTQSDSISEYPKTVTPLCKWRSGQCAFYDTCFGQKELQEY